MRHKGGQILPSITTLDVVYQPAFSVMWTVSNNKKPLNGAETCERPYLITLRKWW